MIAPGTLAGMGAPRLGLLAVGAAASAVGASSAGTPAAQALSALHVPRALAVGRDVRISFRASQRPPTAERPPQRPLAARLHAQPGEHPERHR